MNTPRFCTALLAATVMLGLANTAFAEANNAPPVALDGNCAVCLVKAGKLVPGTKDFAAVYDGYTYLFPSAKERDVFNGNPEAFAPVLNGDCIVCVEKANARVPGTTNHVSIYDERVYLFPEAAQKAMFDQNPAAYKDADLAIDGNCAVCLRKAGKEVPGKAEFAARHNGWRYLFPSDKERQAFLNAPEQFVVSTTGHTDCAACSYGVHPVGSPDQLGLAVKANDGRIYIVEDAHQRYADLYKQRFGKVRVNVVGTPLKSQGQFTWIEPTFVKVAEKN